MNHRNNKRSEATKNKIKQALVEMLKEQDISKITVMALCEKADINRSTFYNHYSSPKSILKGIQNEFLHMVTTYAKRILESEEENKQNALIQLMSDIYGFISDNLETCKILSDSHLCPDMPAALLNTSAIRRCLRLSLKDEYSEEQIEYVYQFIFHGTFHTLDYWMKKGCEDSPEEIAELITNIISKF